MVCLGFPREPPGRRCAWFAYPQMSVKVETWRPLVIDGGRTVKSQHTRHVEHPICCPYPLGMVVRVNGRINRDSLMVSNGVYIDQRVRVRIIVRIWVRGTVFGSMVYFIQSSQNLTIITNAI